MCSQEEVDWKELINQMALSCLDTPQVLETLAHVCHSGARRALAARLHHDGVSRGLSLAHSFNRFAMSSASLPPLLLPNFAASTAAIFNVLATVLRLESFAFLQLSRRRFLPPFSTFLPPFLAAVFNLLPPFPGTPKGPKMDHRRGGYRGVPTPNAVQDQG